MRLVVVAAVERDVDQVRADSQPLERPDKDEDLLRLFEMMDAEHLLMFSSDYPHWDFDDPRFMLNRLPDSWRAKVLHENAAELYGARLALPADA